MAMDTDVTCPFCHKILQIEQEDHNSFIVICSSFPCSDFFLTNPLSGPTPEDARTKLSEFIVQLGMGGEFWASKIKAGLGDD